MTKKIYQNENALLIIASVISLIFWVLIIYATKGFILLVLPIFFIGYLFAQSYFISHMKGTGALVSANQFSDLQKQVEICAERVGLSKLPDVYVLNGNGLFNAFATRFLRKNYIILLSDVLDALEDDQDVINFYIGHEMGHLDRKHLLIEPFISIALALPLLGSAYFRSREYTCDLYGASCCSVDDARRGLALLAVGAKRYKTLNIKDYMEQSQLTSGFWMSFNELVSAYPWLVKRCTQLDSSNSPYAYRIPQRNPFAYIFAIFVPRLSLVSLIVIYILILMSAGIFKGQELISNVKKLESNTQVIGNSPDEYDAAVGNVLNNMDKSILNSTVNEINKSTPMEIKAGVVLVKASSEYENNLTYTYRISEDVDFASLKSSSYPQEIDWWCIKEETKEMRRMKVEVVYNYYNENNILLGSIQINTKDCELDKILFQK